MNIFFRALLVLLFIGVAIFAFARQFGSEKWKNGKEGSKSWPPSKATLWTGLKRIGVPGLIVALVFLLGQLIIEFDALQEKREHQEALEIRSQALEAVYDLEDGGDIPSDIYEYSRKNDVAPVVPPYYKEGFPDWAENVDIDPKDDIRIRASLTGNAWKTNCNGNAPMAKLTLHTPGGTWQGGSRYLGFFNERGNLRMNIRTEFGGRIDLNVGCPTRDKFLRLNYEVESFMVNREERV